MTDNLDDFDDDFNDGNVQRSAPAQKPTMANNLSAAWQGSPLFKLFVLVVGVGAVAAAVIGIFSGSGPDKRQSVSVSGAPSISAVPGSAAPPAYNEAVTEASNKRADEALQQGKSALPTPISPDTTNAALGNEPETSSYDPLNEFRPQVPQENATAQNMETVPTDMVDTDLLGKMQSQMTSLFDAWKPEGIRVVQVVDPATLVKQDTAPAQPAAAKGRVIVPAGTISYAQLMVEANSDAPGPILAEIMSGPFTGGRAIGEFEVTREYLILRFSKITYKRKDYAIDALALDPNTTLGGLVTEKDNRYFTRVLLPSAAAFLEGFGGAISSPSQSTVVTSSGPVIVQDSQQGLEDGLYKGLSEASRTVGSFFRDEANATKPLVRVAVGTPMGLFFVNTVTEDSTGQTIQTPMSPSQQPGINNRSNPLPIPNTSPNSGILNNGANGVILGGSQSSLANTGLNVIQNTPR